jgi:CheY-like chemotaxis protein
MTMPIFALPLSLPIPSPLKKKRVLLVDNSSTKRDVRADVMRKLGMEVDCAADIGEARSWWRADLYNLVLINTENDLVHRDKFCEDIRSATPPQQLAFLVGKPEYLADSPNMDGVAFIQQDGGLPGNVPAMHSNGVSGNLAQRWGILEACQRISVVRSVSGARSKAMRERPAPPRDPEAPRSKRAAAASQALNELLQREEML